VHFNIARHGIFQQFGRPGGGLRSVSALVVILVVRIINWQDSFPKWVKRGFQPYATHATYSIRKKWPMTWLEFVTWYGLHRIRTMFYFSCEACFGPCVACMRSLRKSCLKPRVACVACVRLETGLYCVDVDSSVSVTLSSTITHSLSLLRCRQMLR